MPIPRFCPNPDCPSSRHPPRNWYVRNGTYRTLAHGTVHRFRCRACGAGSSTQTESLHYYAKRRLDLRQILSRVRGGSSLRDIARELGCSPTAVANAVLRLGRQAIASHAWLLTAVDPVSRFVFDGLQSALCSRDYPSHITTLVDAATEVVLTMTHCVTERGGTRSAQQRRRIVSRRRRWTPPAGGLSRSIARVVNELPRHGSPVMRLDTDEHPLYRSVISRDAAMRWYTRMGLLHWHRTPGSAPRTTRNPLFAVNYVDRMIRHRVKEHTRQTIAMGRCATMQMMRMWIFAWDHNVRQPMRVAGSRPECRVRYAGASAAEVSRLRREFYTRRRSLRGVEVPHSMREVWLGRLVSPPVRWRVVQKRSGPVITAYAKRDLSFAHHHGA